MNVEIKNEEDLLRIKELKLLQDVAINLIKNNTDKGLVVKFIDEALVSIAVVHMNDEEKEEWSKLQSLQDASSLESLGERSSLNENDFNKDEDE